MGTATLGAIIDKMNSNIWISESIVIIQHLVIYLHKFILEARLIIYYVLKAYFI